MPIFNVTRLSYEEYVLVLTSIWIKPRVKPPGHSATYAGLAADQASDQANTSPLQIHSAAVTVPITASVPARGSLTQRCQFMKMVGGPRLTDLANLPTPIFFSSDFGHFILNIQKIKNKKMKEKRKI